MLKGKKNSLRDKASSRTSFRCGTDLRILELPVREFKITVSDLLRALVEKVDDGKVQGKFRWEMQAERWKL